MEHSSTPILDLVLIGLVVGCAVIAYERRLGS
jgi:hypothetical protein